MNPRAYGIEAAVRAGWRMIDIVEEIAKSTDPDLTDANFRQIYRRAKDAESSKVQQRTVHTEAIDQWLRDNGFWLPDLGVGIRQAVEEIERLVQAAKDNPEALSYEGALTLLDAFVSMQELIDKHILPRYAEHLKRFDRVKKAIGKAC